MFLFGRPPVLLPYLTKKKKVSIWIVFLLKHKTWMYLNEYSLSTHLGQRNPLRNLVVQSKIMLLFSYNIGLNAKGQIIWNLK